MKKLIFGLIATVLFTGLSFGHNSTKFNNHSVIADYPFIFNTNNLNEDLKKFADVHVSISKKIISLIENEKKLNFDNFPYSKLNASNNEEEFKEALANTGMVNYKEIYNLLLLQNQNAAEFIAKNEEFKSLKEEERNRIITDAIKTAITSSPLNFEAPIGTDNTTLARTCAQQYQIDRADCAEDALINWGILAAGCWFGTPAACAVGGVGVLAIAAVCSSRAKRDYASCMN
jgi:hypothetical protein